MHHWQTPQGYVIESKTFSGLVLRYYYQVLRQKFAQSTPIIQSLLPNWRKKPADSNLEQSVPKTIEITQIQSNP